MTGSAPRTYLMVKPGYLAGRSLLMNAATCGYAPSRHPQTSSTALTYFTFSRLAEPPSSVQHCSQSLATTAKSKFLQSLQAEQSSLAELNPLSRHFAASIPAASVLSAAQCMVSRTWVTIMPSQSMLASKVGPGPVSCRSESS